MKAYGQSKLANVLFARSLAKQLQGEVRWSCDQGMHAYAHMVRDLARKNYLMTDFKFDSLRKVLMSVLRGLMVNF